MDLQAVFVAPNFDEALLYTLVRNMTLIFDILTEEIAVEVTGVVGVSPTLWYFRYRASIFLS